MRWLIPLLVACHAERFALTEVPILGADPTQERILREELRRFDSWTEGTVQLKKVKVQGLSGPIAGKYRDDVVRLSSALPDHQLEGVARHELCHALDDALGWPSDRDPRAEQVFDLLIAQGVPSADRSDVHDRREGFAMLCERGPTGVAVLDACSDEVPLLADLGADLAEMAWPAHVVTPERRREVLWSVDAQGAPELSVSATLDAIYIQGIFPDDVVGLTDDPYTGNGLVNVHSGEHVRLGLVVEEYTPFPDPPSDLYYVFGGQGDAALGVAWHRDELGTESIVTVVDGRWSPIDEACPRAGEVFFAFEGGLGTAWLEDDRAVVAELVPR